MEKDDEYMEEDTKKISSQEKLDAELGIYNDTSKTNENDLMMLRQRSVSEEEKLKFKGGEEDEMQQVDEVQSKEEELKEEFRE